MKRALAFLVLLPFLLCFWIFLGFVLVVCLAFQTLLVASTCVVRVAKGHEETFVGLWRLKWEESFPVFVWQIIRHPI